MSLKTIALTLWKAVRDVFSQAEDEPDLEIAERLLALSKRGVNGRDAWRCCVAARRQSQNIITQLAVRMRELAENPPLSEALMVPAPPSSVLRLISLRRPVLESPKLVVGWSMPETIEQEELNLPTTEAQIQLVEHWLRIATETIRRTEPDCLSCVESKVWQQRTPRKYFRLSMPKTGQRVGRIRRRTPGGNKP